MVKVMITFAVPENIETEDFCKRSCILPISVGQNYHEGELFLETAEMIAGTFKNVLLVVADSLQRHTIAIENNINSDFDNSHECFAHAIKLGEEWLKRNEKAVNILETKSVLKILHWEDLRTYDTKKNIYLTQHYTDLYSTGYEEKQQKLNSDAVAFCNAVQRTVSGMYMKKHKSQATFFDENSIFAKNTLRYVLEETALFDMFINENFMNENFLTNPLIAYPSRLNSAMYYVLEKINRGRDFYLLTPITIRINEIKEKKVFVPKARQAKTIKPATEEIIVDTHKTKQANQDFIDQNESVQNISNNQEIQSNFGVMQNINSVVTPNLTVLPKHSLMKNINQNCISNNVMHTHYNFDLLKLQEHLDQYMTAQYELNGMLMSFVTLMNKAFSIGLNSDKSIQQNNDATTQQLKAQLLQLDQFLFNKMLNLKPLNTQPQLQEHFPIEATIETKLAINETQQYETNHTI